MRFLDCLKILYFNVLHVQPRHHQDVLDVSKLFLEFITLDLGNFSDSLGDVKFLSNQLLFLISLFMHYSVFIIVTLGDCLQSIITVFLSIVHFLLKIDYLRL